MTTTNKINFDELDKKCLSELPIILDVLTSTMNKISRILKPYYDDLSKTVNLYIPKGWQIDDKSNQNVFYPLISTEYGRTKITSLECHFQLENSIDLVKKRETKLINFFNIHFGFYYSNDVADTPCLYFKISKFSPNEYSCAIRTLIPEISGHPFLF